MRPRRLWESRQPTFFGDIFGSRVGAGRSPPGVMLGLAQLTKFTMLLLYAVWPFLWLVRLVLVIPKAEWPTRMPRALGDGITIVVLSILMIDAGYFFEGVGIPLGDSKFEFASRSLTRPVTPEMKRPHSKNLLLEATWQFRVNRFRGSWMERIPCPLPEHYVLGFDEQKIETEGIPTRFFKAVSAPDQAERDRMVETERGLPETSSEPKDAYPVYLNGELRRTGWWYYYLLCLVYKVPEGTWLLIMLSLVSLRFVPRTSAEWADEIALWTVPVVILFSMSFLTDINLGLRYVLAVLPYLFIATGKLVPWMLGLVGTRRWVMTALVVVSLGSTVASSIWIHPHYLAFFNWASGRSRPGAGEVDRQQSRLGPRLGRTPEVVEENDPGPADRTGLLRPDQPVDLQAPRRFVRLVPASRQTRGSATDGSVFASGFGRSRQETHAGLLCGQCVVALWFAVAAL